MVFAEWYVRLQLQCYVQGVTKKNTDICCRQAGMQLEHYGEALEGGSDNVRVNS
jgi:hypothetical protein